MWVLPLPRMALQSLHISTLLSWGIVEPPESVGLTPPADEEKCRGLYGSASSFGLHEKRSFK